MQRLMLVVALFLAGCATTEQGAALRCARTMARDSLGDCSTMADIAYIEAHDICPLSQWYILTLRNENTGSVHAVVLSEDGEVYSPPKEITDLVYLEEQGWKEIARWKLARVQVDELR